MLLRIWKIVPFDLRQYGGCLILQKDSFLCAAKGVSIGIAFQRKFGVGLFGGEGFIMQKLEGDGLTFCLWNFIAEIELAPGRQLMVDTGCLVALTPSVSYDIEMVKGIKSAFFGGEGLFLSALLVRARYGCNQPCLLIAWLIELLLRLARQRVVRVKEVF